MDPITTAVVVVAGIAGAAFYWFRGRKGASASSPALPAGKAAPDVGLEPNVPVTMSADKLAAHKENRPLFLAAATKILGRAPNLAELQYFQAIAGGLESFYGGGWKGAMIGSHNYGAIQCSSAEQGGGGGGGSSLTPAQQSTLDEIKKLNASIDAAAAKANAASKANAQVTRSDDSPKAEGGAVNDALAKIGNSGPPPTAAQVKSTQDEIAKLNASIDAAAAKANAANNGSTPGWSSSAPTASGEGSDFTSGAPDYECVDYQDSRPDGSTYNIKFKKYVSAAAGIEDLARLVFSQRPQVVKALESSAPSAFRASLAMRRTRYFGGFCPKATAQYGAEAAAASFGSPDRDAGTKACQAECVSAHAASIARIIAEIATANGDAMRLPLGDLESALAWYTSIASA